VITLENLVTKNYEENYEAKIVRFLNLCFGGWGNVVKWLYLYKYYPTFSDDDVVIIENRDGKIIGHGGLHIKDFMIRHKYKVPVALFCDAAVHPNHRGKGIYSKIIKLRFDSAKSRGASLVFWWVLKGATPYKIGIKRGFIEVKQPPIYMKILKPESIIKAGIKEDSHHFTSYIIWRN
jgi:GNAT superfamily N-acetyltransferase